MQGPLCRNYRNSFNDFRLIVDEFGAFTFSYGSRHAAGVGQFNHSSDDQFTGRAKVTTNHSKPSNGLESDVEAQLLDGITDELQITYKILSGYSKGLVITEYFTRDDGLSDLLEEFEQVTGAD